MFAYIGETFLVLLAVILLARALITDPADYPGWTDLQVCAKAAYTGCIGCTDGIWNVIGCSSWNCACDDFAGAMSALSSGAASACSTDPAQVTSATSIFSAFCAQLLATPTGSSTPTTVPTRVITPTTVTTGTDEKSSLIIKALILEPLLALPAIRRHLPPVLQPLISLVLRLVWRAY
jgi:hypothetical protein